MYFVHSVFQSLFLIVFVCLIPSSVFALPSFVPASLCFSLFPSLSLFYLTFLFNFCFFSCSALCLVFSLFHYFCFLPHFMSFFLPFLCVSHVLSSSFLPLLRSVSFRARIVDLYKTHRNTAVNFHNSEDHSWAQKCLKFEKCAKDGILSHSGKFKWRQYWEFWINWN